MNIDSARANLAGTFVNAFVNAGFGNDKLMVMAEEGNSWIYKNKDHGMLLQIALHRLLTLVSRRYDECGCISWSEFTVGDGRGYQSC